MISLHNRHQGLDSVGVGEVDDHRVPTHFGRHGTELVGSPGSYQYVGTCRRVRPGQRGPDPLRSTGHQYLCADQFHAGDRSPTIEPASRPDGHHGYGRPRPGSGA